MTCVPSTCDILFYTASISGRESEYELQLDADARRTWYEGYSR